MRSIINGRMYNTDTAVCVAHYSNGRKRSDFHYLRETLYLKKTGEWFLFGRGGAMSKYFVMRGRWQGGGSETIPFTEDEAKKWLSKHGFTDQYTKYFGKPEE